MNLNLEKLTNYMERVFNNVMIQQKTEDLSSLRLDLVNKRDIIDRFICRFNSRTNGKFTEELLDGLLKIKVELNELVKGLDDKFMIFIIGNGNVGKSTLINALIGYEVAKVSFQPTTWKIDVYTPYIKENFAVIKDKDGTELEFLIDKAKWIISDEENKNKSAETKYKENFNKEIKKLRSKEERDEMEKILKEKYLYNSSISEVRWPVNKNWILEKCLLVDTPGLGQNRYVVDNNNVHEYYHKADGVIWMIDGNTISSLNTKKDFEDLDIELKTVGGLRDNIIGVINKIDKVKKNGGEDARDEVMKDAKKIFGTKFHKIIDISAEQAFKGITNNKVEDIEKSGILNLQTSIRDIFISKSENLKKSAKTQGYNNLINVAIEKIDKYYSSINEYENIYEGKLEKLEQLSEKFKKDLLCDIDKFFDTYLRDVSNRVEMYINALGNGEGADYVEKVMYKSDEFMDSIYSLIKNKQLELEDNFYKWQKNCNISEYKYIKNYEFIDYKGEFINLNLCRLNYIEYFRPSINEDVFSFLRNMVGRGAFFFKKERIKTELNNTIKENCDNMRVIIKQRFDEKITESVNHSRSILDLTFSNILFNFNHIANIKFQTEIFKKDITIKKEDVKLKDILL